jgi:hypothetical protein
MLQLALNSARQNITLKLEDISKRLVENVPDLLIDLVEIATYVFCADQATSRGGEAQSGMGSDWRRSFRFISPVRNPDHWNSPNVLEPLCETLSFLSDDDYAFEFERATNPPPLERYLDLGGDEPAAFTPDDVVLFSGGLDSLGGAIEELSSSAKRIALVSHRSSPKIFGHQRLLVAELKNQFPKRLMHIPVLVGRKRLRSESIRSDRGPFFTPHWHALSLGFLEAYGFGSLKTEWSASICPSRHKWLAHVQRGQPILGS